MSLQKTLVKWTFTEWTKTSQVAKKIKIYIQIHMFQK